MVVPYKKLYEKMVLIRRFEELLLDLFSNGKLFGTTHTYVGQEAIAVSAMAHLKQSDIVFSNHRCHGHFLAKENDPEGLLAEIMGRENGVCGGRGGSQHLHKNNFYSNGIQGGIVANALGMAFAEKFKETGNIVVVFMGDGTWGEGICYEALNMSSLWNVPLLVVVENNRYAQSTSVELNLAGSIIKRVQAFDIEVGEIESNDVTVLYPIFKKAVRFVREKQKPFVQIINTYRLNAHSKGDDDRSKEEINRWWKKEPLQYVETRISKEQIQQTKRSVEIKLQKIERRVNAMEYGSIK
ncbi:thiamine pyrophosphate-dependent dehydrogenase E1 component subunit alpha [Verrucomicrobia bacterium]|nr:thiamine pyrophosphate-dependent dehydrogenase E1 component subunit alpha [Verrucomicrobiota bacterium]